MSNDAYEEALKLIERKGLEEGTRYILQARTKDCKKTRVESLQTWKIHFEDLRGDIPIAYDGVPFIIIGREVRECHFGKLRKKKKGNKQVEEVSDEHGYSFNKRRKIQNSKKHGCRALVKMRMIIRFPQYQITEPDSFKKRLEVSQKLKANFSMEDQQDYCVLMKYCNEHNDHNEQINDEEEDFGQPVEPVLKDEIAEAADVQKILDDFKETNSTCSPTLDDLQGHVAAAALKFDGSNAYEEALNLIKKRELEEGTKYNLQARTKDCKKTRVESLQTWRIHYEDLRGEIPIAFDGVPFIIIGREVRECHFGKSRVKKKEENKQVEEAPDEQSNSSKKRKRPSKKHDCSALVKMRMIIRFPQYKVSEPDSHKKRLEGLRKLRAKFSLNDQQDYCVLMKYCNEHNGHNEQMVCERADFDQPVETVHEDLLTSEADVQNVVDVSNEQLLPSSTELYCAFSPTLDDSQEYTATPLKFETSTAYEEALKLIEKKELEEGTRYILQARTKDCKKTRVESLETWRIHFEDLRGDIPIPYDGVPFIIMGMEVRECHFGKLRKKRKGYKQDEEDSDEQSCSSKKRRKLQTSKKYGCSALVKMRMIIRFPQYQITEANCLKKRLEVSRNLKAKFSMFDQQDYCVLMKYCNEHSGHLVGEEADFGQPLDKRVTKRIRELVLEDGLTSAAEVKKVLDDFKKQLPSSTETNRRFNPTMDDIRGHISAALKFKSSTAYEEALKLIEKKELEEGTRYILQARTKDCKKTSVESLQTWRIHFEDLRGDIPIPFDGVPFIIMGMEVRECQFGKLRKKKKGNKQVEEDSDEQSCSTKKRRKLQTSKKHGCSALVKMRMIIRFPQYRVTEPDSVEKRLEVSRNLKAHFSVYDQQEYCVLMKYCNEHSGHVVGEEADFAQPLDKRVTQLIQKLVLEHGLTNAAEVKRVLDDLIKQLPSSTLTNRRLKPTMDDIRRHVSEALKYKSRHQKSLFDNSEVLNATTSIS